MSKISDFIEHGGGFKNFIFATLRGAGEDPFRHAAEAVAEKVKPYLPEVMTGKVGGVMSGLAASYAQFATPDRTPMSDMAFDFFEYMRRGLYNGSVPRFEGWSTEFEKRSRQYIEQVAAEGGNFDEAIAKIEATRNAHQQLDAILGEMKPPPAGQVKINWDPLVETLRSLLMREGDNPGTSTIDLLKARTGELDDSGARAIEELTKPIKAYREKLSDRRAKREKRKGWLKRIFTG